MSGGFNAEAFSLDDLQSALPAEALRSGEMEELRQVLLFQGCRERLLDAEHLADQILESADAELPNVVAAWLQLPSGRRESGRVEP
jgi:hypothetical protein